MHTTTVKSGKLCIVWNEICEVVSEPMVRLERVHTGEVFETRLSNLQAMNHQVQTTSGEE